MFGMVLSELLIFFDVSWKWKHGLQGALHFAENSGAQNFAARRWLKMLL